MSTTPTAAPAAPPAPSTTEFHIEGMTCQNCARHVTEAIQSVPGVASASVRLDAATAAVRWKPDTSRDEPAVMAAVKAAGYAASTSQAPAGDHPHHHHHAAPLSGWGLNVMLGSAVTGLLMLGEWVFGLGMERWFHWAAFALALPVQILCGARFYRGAWNQAKHLNSNMDTLVALGSTTAFAFSAWGLFTGWAGHLYFMEAAAIITLISIGHWLEARMSAKAASSLRALLNLAPEKARRLDANGDEHEVPVAQLNLDDRVALRPGDRVPTDGEVVEGAAAVDETMLTGESVPVDKKPGAKAYGGTVNLNGRLVLRVTATGDATALAQIIAVVERAQNSRAAIQKLGDRVSSVFVLVVILIALATGLWWGLAPESARRVHETLVPFLWHGLLPPSALAAAFIQAAAVLIVACPCAMGLATPAAIMAGTNAAARRGILIRDGTALEKSGRITAALFDKTGTLTEGKLAVVATNDLRYDSARTISIQQLAAALAKPSSHPLSQAVAAVVDKSNVAIPLTPALSPGEREQTAAARRNSTSRSDVAAAVSLSPLPRGEGRGEGNVGAPAATAQPIPIPPRPSSDGLPLTDWQEVRGAGVQALWAEKGAAFAKTTLRLGSLNWLRESEVNLTPGAAFAGDWAAQGATLLGLAADQRLIGLIALRDNLKPDAPAVVQALQRAGKRAYLITGDSRATAAAIGAQAGVPKENIFAEVRPEQKAGIVRQLQERGERIAFVGDGINDAPALEQADLGIAVARASDVAREAADIILLKSDIHAIPEALGLAQATLRTIKQNLFWAFFYNAAAVPLAVLGFLNPVLCAAAMGLSDVVVIGNALRLRRWRAAK